MATADRMSPTVPDAVTARSGTVGRRGAVVFAAYGSARPGAATAAIEPVAAAVAGAVAPVPCALAYTSAPVVRTLRRRGEDAPALEDALGRLARAAGGRIAVLPGFITGGWAMHDLAERARACLGERATVGSPLLAGPADIEALAAALAARHPRRPGSCVLLVAHGEAWPKDSPRPADTDPVDAYAALGRALIARKRTDMLVVTMGSPVEETVRRIRDAGADRVTVAPLMLAAGHHAARQLFGADPASIASRLSAAGLDVERCDEGLGELAAVRSIYAAHARRLLGPWTGLESAR